MIQQVPNRSNKVPNQSTIGPERCLVGPARCPIIQSKVCDRSSRESLDGLSGTSIDLVRLFGQKSDKIVKQIFCFGHLYYTVYQAGSSSSWQEPTSSNCAGSAQLGNQLKICAWLGAGLKGFGISELSLAWLERKCNF